MRMSGNWSRTILRDRIFLGGSEVIDIDHAHFVRGRAAVGKPLAVRGIFNIPYFLFRALKNSPFGFGERIDLNDAVLSVGVKDVLAVRTPLKVTDVGVVVLGDLDRLAPAATS